ncbi:excinuclease ABC subunit A [Bowmanella sp. Y26]|uniref:excinuclease ABC subunit A n=1 Tax=Bowmanella yangjiangensis TaxID=2811230 RepID=UPI001BDC7987|nr:excinuclease ABC subunit A [Bowmanella yangjiangensis]MBT1064186.1 excinuclease ABC subunit A [Bowmanella yangjiangensis]
MKKIAYIAAVAALTSSFAAQARDDRVRFDLEPFLSSGKAKEVLLDVPVYFAGQQHSAIKETWGEVTTSRKTNAFNKSDKEACEWVLLSALKVLQERAKKEGMNAVVNIKSNYKHQEYASAEQFECGAGTFVAGVALKGDIVKL